MPTGSASRALNQRTPNKTPPSINRSTRTQPIGFIQTLTHRTSTVFSISLEALGRARELHVELMTPGLSDKQKSALARQVGGLLFAAEANCLPSARSRILFQRLRNHAHVVSCPTEPQKREIEAIWDEYTELQSAIE